MRSTELGAGRVYLTDSRGGFSRGNFVDDSGAPGLNLATHVGDDPNSVAANRAQLAEYGLTTVWWMEQVHSATCTVAVRDYPAGYTFAATDALIFDARPFPKFRPALAVMVADYLPLAFADTSGKVIGVAHVGRAGLLGGIVESVLHEFACLGIKSEELSVLCCPCISAANYPVGEEICTQVSALYPAARAISADGQPAVDLAAAAVHILRGAGVINVDTSWNDCTFHNGRYYSYRRTKKTGRQAVLIAPSV